MSYLFRHGPPSVENEKQIELKPILLEAQHASETHQKMFDSQKKKIVLK